MVGGQSMRALRRAAALGDVWLCGPVALDALWAEMRRADGACEALGRDPRTLRRNYMTYARGDELIRVIEGARERGVDELLGIVGVSGDDRSLSQAIEEIAAAVAAVRESESAGARTG